MASLSMHLAIAQEYYKKHPDLNYSSFLHGSLQPDLEQDKNKSHYSKQPKNQTLEEIAKSKVDIAEYVKTNDLSNDYLHGEFLHLLTDYLFYYKYLINTDEFKKSGLDNLPQAMKAVFDDYDRIASLLQIHYELDFNYLPDFARGTSKKEPELIRKNDVIHFINYCSSLDLKYEHQKIAKGDINFSFTI